MYNIKSLVDKYNANSCVILDLCSMDETHMIADYLIKRLIKIHQGSRNDGASTRASINVRFFDKSEMTWENTFAVKTKINKAN